jgi:uncharacterized protein YjbI with pentapeptide repeats
MEAGKFSFKFTRQTQKNLVGSSKYAYFSRYATRRYAALRYATLRYATLRYATLRYATLLYATLRYSVHLNIFRTVIEKPEIRICKIFLQLVNDPIRIPFISKLAY